VGFIKDNLVWLLPAFLVGSIATTVGGGNVGTGVEIIIETIISFLFGVNFTGLSTATAIPSDSVSFSAYSGFMTATTTLSSNFAQANLSGVKYDITKVGNDYLFNRDFNISTGDVQTINNMVWSNVITINPNLVCYDWAGRLDIGPFCNGDERFNYQGNSNGVCSKIFGPNYIMTSNTFANGYYNKVSQYGSGFYLYNQNSYQTGNVYTSITCQSPGLIGNSNVTITASQLSAYLGENLITGDTLQNYYVDNNYDVNGMTYEFEALKIYNIVSQKYKFVYRIGNERFVIDDLSIDNQINLNVSQLFTNKIDNSPNNVISMIAIKDDKIILFDKIKENPTCTIYESLNNQTSTIGTNCVNFDNENVLSLVSLNSIAKNQLDLTNPTRTVSNKAKLSIITRDSNGYTNVTYNNYKLVNDVVLTDIKNTNTLSQFTKDRISDYIAVENGDYRYKLKANNKTIDLNQSYIVVLDNNSTLSIPADYEVTEYEFDNLNSKGFQMSNLNYTYYLDSSNTKINIFGMSGINNNISTNQIKVYDSSDYMLNFIDLTSLNNNLNFVDFTGATQTYTGTESISNDNTSIFYVRDLTTNSKQKVFQQSTDKIQFQNSDFETFYYLENSVFSENVCVIGELDSIILSQIGFSVCSNKIMGVQTSSENKLTVS